MSYPLRFIRNKLSSTRFKVRLLCLFIAVAVSYQLVPKNLFRNRNSPTYVGQRDKDFRLPTRLDIDDKHEIIILRYTSYFGIHRDPEVLTSKMCPYSKPSRKVGSGKVFDIPCRITFDRRYFRGSDAVLFHSWDLTREEVPKQRSKEQVWVYYDQECPTYTRPNLRDYSNVFNWTMTYRRDSDIYYSYGHTVPTTESPSDADLIITSNSTSKPYLNLANRPNLVAWIVSNCDSVSKREYFVKELQNYIPVSVYGWCGQDCPAGDCYAHVAKTHKFYLSLENSLCKDYISEKLFIPLRFNLVPVVYGGTGLEDYSAIAPPGSYIDTRNFSSAKHLAEYLVYLDRHEEEYMKYFEWKAKYKVIESQAWCDVCQRAFEHSQLAPESSSSVPSEGKRRYKWYNDLWMWWNYISHESSFKQNEISVTSGLSIIGPSDNSKLGSPACQSPIKNLTGSETNLLDFEPRLFNRKGIYKWAKWAKDKITG